MNENGVYIAEIGFCNNVSEPNERFSTPLLFKSINVRCITKPEVAKNKINFSNFLRFFSEKTFKKSFSILAFIQLISTKTDQKTFQIYFV